MVKFEFSNTLSNFIIIDFKFSWNQLQNMRINSYLFILGIYKIWISCPSFKSKCTLFKLFNTCSLIFTSKNLIKDFFCFFWEKTLHFVINLHDVSLCILHRRPIKRQLTCNHCIQTDSQTPHIDLLRLVFLSSGQFRCCVRRWPTKSVAETTVFFFSHKTEVNEFGIPVSVEHDVFALDVSMENPLRFQVLESWQNLLENLGSESLRKRSIVVDVIKKLSILTEFHENVNFFVAFKELVNSGDVGVEKSFVDFDLKSCLFDF